MFIIQTIYKHLSDGEWELLIVQVHLLTFPQQRDLGGERTLYLNIYCHSAGTSPWKKRFGGGGRVEVCSGLQFMPTSFPPLRRFFLKKNREVSSMIQFHSDRVVFLYAEDCPSVSVIYRGFRQMSDCVQLGKEGGERRTVTLMLHHGCRERVAVGHWEGSFMIVSLLPSLCVTLLNSLTPSSAPCSTPPFLASILSPYSPPHKRAASASLCDSPPSFQCTVHKPW